MSKAKEAEVKEKVTEEVVIEEQPGWTYIGGGGRVIHMPAEDEKPRSPEEVAKVVAEADRLAAEKGE